METFQTKTMDNWESFRFSEKWAKIEKSPCIWYCQKLGVFKNYEILQKIFFFEKMGKNALNHE
jgi:hypothetical protein